MSIATFGRLIIFAFLLASSVHAAGVPDDCTQLLMAVAPDWNSIQGEMRMYERERGGPWKQQGAPIAVLFGKNGLAWGTGLAGQDETGTSEKGARRPRARRRFFASAQSTPTMPNFRPAQIIHSIR